MEDWVYRSKKYRLLKYADTNITSDLVAEQYKGYQLIACDGCTEQEFRAIVHANWATIFKEKGDDGSVLDILRDIITYLYEGVDDHYVLMMLDYSTWNSVVGFDQAAVNKQIYSDITDKKLKAKYIDSVDALRL